MTPTCQYRAVRRSRGRHSAFTLTELLIVMLIMVIVAVIALPLAKKLMEDAQTREASRQVQSFFSMAQTRASQTGRPAGLYLKLDPLLGDLTTNARQVTQMYLAEVPPPYVGMTLNARGGIYSPAPTGIPQFLPVNSSGQIDTTERDYIGQVLVAPGELFLVRFGYKGPYYRCRRGGGNPPDPLYPDQGIFYYMGTTQGFTPLPVPPGLGQPGPTYSVAQPFQILLPPRRAGSPLELTGGTCIDITYSGIGLHETFPSLYPTMQGESIVVMFKPGGEIDAVWVDGGVDGSTIPGMVHFLVGKVEKVGLAVAQSNLADFNSFWVTVGRMGGGVSTSENLFNPNATPVGTETALQAHIREARSAATGREQMEGR